MLQIDGFEKRYPGGKGTGPLSLTVPGGQVCAVVGPNGAGKSTLFNSIAGVLDGYSGTWSLGGADGRDVGPREVGYLPERPFCFPDFTPREFCMFDSSMRGLGLGPAGVAELLERLDCGEFADKRISSLSQGMAKRVAIACALAGRPQLVLLDEPLNAIDIKTTLLLKEELARLRADGCAVLVSSHVLDFVGDVADRVVFLDGGRVRADFDPRERDAEDMYREFFL